MLMTFLLSLTRLILYYIGNSLVFLNNKHPNIKFTVQLESNHCLHFFDIDIKFINGVFKIFTYNKPSSADLYIVWNSLSLGASASSASPIAPRQ